MKTSKEEPEMWECVNFYSKDPSVHGYISLTEYIMMVGTIIRLAKQINAGPKTYGL